MSAGSAGGRGRGKRAEKAEKKVLGFLKEERVVAGRVGATALLIAYSASVMTLGKTVLYCECFMYLVGRLYCGHIADMSRAERGFLWL